MTAENTGSHALMSPSALCKIGRPAWSKRHTRNRSPLHCGFSDPARLSVRYNGCGSLMNSVLFFGLRNGETGRDKVSEPELNPITLVI